MKLVATAFLTILCIGGFTKDAHALCFDLWIDSYNDWGPRHLDECARSRSQICSPARASDFDRRMATEGGYKWHTVERLGEETTIRIGWQCAGNIGIMLQFAKMSPGTRCGDVANKWAEQIIAVALAGANKKCNWCPADNLLESKIGQRLSKTAGSAGSKAWQQLTKQCRPAPEPEIETACPEAKDPYLGFPRYTDQPIDPRTSSGAANVADLARLSYAAYRDNEHTVSRAAGGSFERQRFERNIITGFDVATYVDRENRNAVISYRGTEPDDPRDLYTTFFLQFFDQFNLPPQFRQAVRYAEEEIARLQAGGYTVVVTGHSLGGAMSEVVHQVTGVTAVTFNPTAAPTRRWEENLFLQPVRRTGTNLLRVFNSDDIARETDYAHTEREGGSSYMVEYPTENRVDAHSMLKLAEYLGESYDEIAQRSGENAEECPE